MVTPLLMTGLKSLSLMHKSVIENLFLGGQMHKRRGRLDEMKWVCVAAVTPVTMETLYLCLLFQVSAVKLNKPAWPIYSVCIFGCTRRWFTRMLKTATCCNTYTQARTRTHMRTLQMCWQVMTALFLLPLVTSHFTTCFGFFFLRYPALVWAWWQSASFCNTHPNHHFTFITVTPHAHRQRLTTSLQLIGQ